MIVLAAAIAGAALSAYGLWVETRPAGHKPLCDISPRISCTKAFKSKYGKLLWLPNSAYGVLFYLAVLVLSLLGMESAVLALAVLSALGSIFLAYLLYAKVRTLCIVCTGIYLVNLLLLVGAWIALRA